MAKTSSATADKKPTNETVIEIIFRDGSVKKAGRAVFFCKISLIRSAKRSGITTKAIGSTVQRIEMTIALKKEQLNELDTRLTKTPMAASAQIPRKTQTRANVSLFFTCLSPDSSKAKL